MSELAKAELAARLDVAYAARNAVGNSAHWDDVSTCISRLVVARLRLEIERGTLGIVSTEDTEQPRPDVRLTYAEWKAAEAKARKEHPPLKPGETFTPDVVYSDRDIEMFARGMQNSDQPQQPWNGLPEAVKGAYISTARYRLGIVFDGRGRPGEPRK